MWEDVVVSAWPGFDFTCNSYLLSSSRRTELEAFDRIFKGIMRVKGFLKNRGILNYIVSYYIFVLLFRFLHPHGSIDERGPSTLIFRSVFYL